MSFDERFLCYTNTLTFGLSCLKERMMGGASQRYKNCSSGMDHVQSFIFLWTNLTRILLLISFFFWFFTDLLLEQIEHDHLLMSNELKTILPFLHTNIVRYRREISLRFHSFKSAQNKNEKSLFLLLYHLSSLILKSFFIKINSRFLRRKVFHFKLNVCLTLRILFLDFYQNS